MSAAQPQGMVRVVLHKGSSTFGAPTLRTAELPRLLDDCVRRLGFACVQQVPGVLALLRHGPLTLPVRGSDGHSTLIFLERLATREPFGPADLVSAELALPLVDALVEQHRKRGKNVNVVVEDALVHARVGSALINFGRSRLTEREQQVLIYALRGYSAALTAQKLQVAVGTIKNHRKAIHRKLEVRSQSELFSLFINSIPFASVGNDLDPLIAYEQPVNKVACRTPLQ